MRSVLITLFFALSLFGQYAPDPTPQIEKMKPFTALAGEWEGSGWKQFGPNKSEFTQSEHIEVQLDGLLLEVHGEGKNSNGEVVHKAFAIISYHPQKGYRFNSWTKEGRYVDAEAGVEEDGTLFWTFDIPNRGTTRYEIEISDNGTTWHEKGFFSRDGENWNTFLEMNLKRVSKE